MILQVLGSSSKGNGYLLRSETTGEILVVEAGRPITDIKNSVGHHISYIAGCIVSHEHGDHARYASSYMSEYIPVYASPKTLQKLAVKNDRYRSMMRPMMELRPRRIGSFTVKPFPIEHDAAQPYGFIIHHDECGNVLFATDTYYIQYAFDNIDNIMIECNYNEEILHQKYKDGNIGKARYERTIQSHMSYDQCISTLSTCCTPSVQNIVLLHLSDTNSDEKKIRSGVEELYPVQIITVASPGTVISFNKAPY